MKFLTFLIAALTLAIAPAVGAQAMLCSQVGGASLFKDSDAIHVLRKGERVTIQPHDQKTGIRDDAWTYQVVAEAPGVGYRATRTSNSKPGAFTVLFSGELFAISESGKIGLFVTATNAASKTSESASFTCISLP